MDGLTATYHETESDRASSVGFDSHIRGAMTDRERLNLLERIGYFTSQCDGHGIEFFTEVSQHVRATTLREALDIVMDYESGERCWKCENWSFHNHERDGS